DSTREMFRANLGLKRRPPPRSARPEPKGCSGSSERKGERRISPSERDVEAHDRDRVAVILRNSKGLSRTGGRNRLDRIGLVLRNVPCVPQRRAWLARRGPVLGTDVLAP